ncbi:MAG: redoxin domain-containing protein [Rubrobacter sp.]
MSSAFPRPVLLGFVAVLILGAIFFIQGRFAPSDPGASGAEPQPVARVAAPEETASRQVQETMREEKTSSPEESTLREPAVDPEAERIAVKGAEFERAAEISSPSGFINTDADGITILENLGDRVLLLDFWTYSCFNCQNTQPYLNAWQEKYADEGLVIIGVHKPEFEFEKDYAGVEEAVRQAGITYPVVLDNEDATWNAYDQRFWPTMYLIDSDGFVRYEHIGEGAYEETEATIRELLAERDRNLD